MRFTLTYDGVLPSKGNPDAKHHIRRALHPQVKMLWQEVPLSQNSAWIEHGDSSDNGQFLSAISGREFASIVHPWQNLYAEIDILMLRPGAPGSIIVDGDIDNRIKTLFDALRVPNKQEIPSPAVAAVS